MLKYILVFSLFSCASVPAKNHRQFFDDFHTYFEKADFDKMGHLLDDDFIITNSHGNPDPKTDYIKYMTDWNKTFDTKWHVISVDNSGDEIKSIEYDTDIFNDYFYNGKMKYLYTYTFSGDHITRLNAETMPGDDQLRVNFRERFKKFMDWVSQNHPEKLVFCTKRDKHSAEEIKLLLENYLNNIKI